LVAVTIQIPAAVDERVVPDTEHGPELTTNEFDPAPSPPEVVRESVAPYVPVIDVIVKALV
jgi:hypothetical protein